MQESKGQGCKMIEMTGERNNQRKDLLKNMF